MTKRRDNGKQPQFLRFSPYRAIVASPIKDQEKTSKRLPLVIGVPVVLVAVGWVMWRYCTR
jgi:hypothetical protein